MLASVQYISPNNTVKEMRYFCLFEHCGLSPSFGQWNCMLGNSSKEIPYFIHLRYCNFTEKRDQS